MIFSKSIAKCMLKDNVYTPKNSNQKVNNWSKVVTSLYPQTHRPFSIFRNYFLYSTWNYPEMLSIFALFCRVFIILVTNISISVWNIFFRRYFNLSAVNHFRKKPQLTQPAFTFSRVKIETLEQGLKYVQS